MATLTLQPDATAGKDTYLRAGSGANNFGASTYIAVQYGPGFGWYSASLLRFDYSTLPAGCTVTSDTMSVYFYGGTSMTTELRQMLKDWTEGTKNETTAAAGEVTYDFQIYNTTAWQTQGARGLQDRSGTQMASASAPGASGWVSLSGANMVAFVQGVVNGSITNYGRRLASPGPTDYGLDTMSFYSSDYTTDTTIRPKEVIEYTESGVISPFVSFRNI
jgi:hypothetical protein